jgi:hypothetical protein
MHETQITVRKKPEGVPRNMLAAAVNIAFEAGRRYAIAGVDERATALRSRADAARFVEDVALDDTSASGLRVHAIACWLLWGDPPAAEFYGDGSWSTGGPWGDERTAKWMAEFIGYDYGSYLGSARKSLSRARHLRTSGAAAHAPAHG